MLGLWTDSALFCFTTSFGFRPSACCRLCWQLPAASARGKASDPLVDCLWLVPNSTVVTGVACLWSHGLGREPARCCRVTLGG